MVMYTAWSTGIVQPVGAVGEIVGMESHCCRHLRPSIFIAFCVTSLQHGKGTEIIYLGSILELKLSQKAPKKTALLDSAVFWAWIESLSF